MRRDLQAAVSVALIVVGLVAGGRFLSKEETSLVLLLMIALSSILAALSGLRSIWRKEPPRTTPGRRLAVIAIMLGLGSLATFGTVSMIGQTLPGWSAGHVLMGTTALLALVAGWMLLQAVLWGPPRKRREHKT